MKKENGFTLIELLIAMTISTLVAAGVVTAYLSQQNTQLAQQQTVEMQQTLRVALDIMSREIRMAGYDPASLNGVGIIANGTGGVGDPLSFSYYVDFGEDGIDNDSDGEIDEPDIDTDGDGDIDVFGGENGEGYTLYAVSYELSSVQDVDGDTDLVMTTGGNVYILAENVSALTFSYLYDPAASADLLDIRAVQVAITVTRDVNERALAATNHTMTTMVKCRNLGL